MVDSIILVSWRVFDYVVWDLKTYSSPDIVFRLDWVVFVKISCHALTIFFLEIQRLHFIEGFFSFWTFLIGFLYLLFSTYRWIKKNAVLGKIVHFLNFECGHDSKIAFTYMWGSKNMKEIEKYKISKSVSKHFRGCSIFQWIDYFCVGFNE